MKLTLLAMVTVGLNTMARAFAYGVGSAEGKISTDDCKTKKCSGLHKVWHERCETGCTLDLATCEPWLTHIDEYRYQYADLVTGCAFKWGTLKEQAYASLKGELIAEIDEIAERLDEIAAVRESISVKRKAISVKRKVLAAKAEELRTSNSKMEVDPTLLDVPPTSLETDDKVCKADLAGARAELASSKTCTPSDRGSLAESCDVMNCRDWTCNGPGVENWCTCFTEEAEKLKIFELLGCGQDGSTCRCET